MKVLIDTNILARAAQPDNPDHALATSAPAKLKHRGDQPCLVVQIFYEFWAVATRPASQNGLQLTVQQTWNEFAQLKVLLGLPALDHPDTFGEWEKLVRDHDVKGKETHDARIVAAMKVHAIPAILTFNTKDFARYPGITVIHPSDLDAR